MAHFEFTSPTEEDELSSRFPPIEELSGGAFTSSLTARSVSQSPKKVSTEEVDALADDAFALPVQPYRRHEVATLADDAFKFERATPAQTIKAALEREKNNTEWVEPIEKAASSSDENEEEEEERVVKPSEVIARGGVYATQTHTTVAPHTVSAPTIVASPPVMVPETRVPDIRNKELLRKAEQSRRIIDESRKILDQQWPDTKEPVPERPKMITIGVNTSPPPSPPPVKKPKEIQKPPSVIILPSPPVQLTEPPSRTPNFSATQFIMQETEVRALPPRSRTPGPSPSKSPQKDYIVPDPQRPKSRAGYFESGSSPLGKGHPKQRPLSLYVDNDIEFLRSYDGKPTPLERSFTGLSTSSQPASLPSNTSETVMPVVPPHVDSEQDLDFLRMKDEEGKSLTRQISDHFHDHIHREPSREQHNNGQRSSSSGPNVKHSRQTSLGVLSKGIMSGKFGEAFRKFEGRGHHEPKTSESRLRAEKTLARAPPEEAAVDDEEGEDWRVETHEIPTKLKRHLSERRRISSERPRAPVGPTVVTASQNISQRAGPAKAKLIQERMNEYLSSQTREPPPPLTAEGYGPYINEARAIRNPADKEEIHQPVERKGTKSAPNVLPKPPVLRRPSLKGVVD